MIELETVFSDYAKTKLQIKWVPGYNSTPALRSIRADIPRAFSRFITAANLDIANFRVYGSVGQPGRSLAAVPWVAICKRTVTSSTNKGYFIVALFSEDMSSVTLSLNQGFADFLERYGTPRLAREKIADSARRALQRVSLHPRFVSGPINLQSKGKLARGYEAASILATSYSANATPEECVVQEDMYFLLKTYLELTKYFPESLEHQEDEDQIDKKSSIKQTIAASEDLPAEEQVADDTNHSLVAQDICFYVQQVTPSQNSSDRKLALLDFQHLNDHLLIARSANPNIILPRGFDDNQASMLEFEYTPDSRLGLRQGSWYRVPLTFWEGMSYQPITPENAGGVYMKGKLQADTAAINFSQFLVDRRYAKVSTGSVDLPDEPITSPVELIVVNCGQGNWNEILTPKTRLIFDVGACRTYNENQVLALVASRNIATEKRKVTIVLSHWDIDHYQALLKFSKAEIAVIDQIYAPDLLPDTHTQKNVQKMFNGKITCIPAANKANAGNKINLIQTTHQPPFRILRATRGNSTNQSGIVVFVDGPTKTALLTGDHHYSKILTAANNLTTSCAAVLVVPHHGGKGGPLDQGAWNAKFTSLDAPISVGNNPWGHPWTVYTTPLQAIQGSPLSRTDKHGTLTYTL